METAQTKSGSTTEYHIAGYVPGTTETYPMVELKITIECDSSILEKVMNAIHEVHNYQ